MCFIVDIKDTKMGQITIIKSIKGCQYHKSFSSVFCFVLTGHSFYPQLLKMIFLSGLFALRFMFNPQY